MKRRGPFPVSTGKIWADCESLDQVRRQLRRLHPRLRHIAVDGAGRGIDLDRPPEALVAFNRSPLIRTDPPSGRSATMADSVSGAARATRPAPAIRTEAPGPMLPPASQIPGISPRVISNAAIRITFSTAARMTACHSRRPTAVRSRPRDRRTDAGDSGALAESGAKAASTTVVTPTCRTGDVCLAGTRGRPNPSPRCPAHCSGTGDSMAVRRGARGRPVSTSTSPSTPA